MCVICGVPEYISCNCSSYEEDICVPCLDETKCIQKIDAECVIYHLDNTTPTNLTCLGIPNQTNLQSILEAIDTKICNASTLETPLTVIDTSSVDLTALGTANHTLSADVKLSSDAGNSITITDTGLYSPTCDGKVKVDSTGTLDYLINQVSGGTDGIVTITVTEVGGQLIITPTINIPALLDLIQSDNLTQFC